MMSILYVFFIPEVKNRAMIRLLTECCATLHIG